MGPDTDTGSPSARMAGRLSGVTLPVWAAIGLVLATAVVSGYLGARWAAEDLRAELALRPPVVLFDMAGAVRGVAPDQLDTVIAREKKQTARLAEGGFLVLDAQAVIAAPPDLFIHSASILDDIGGPPR